MLLFVEQTMSAKADTASVYCVLDYPGKAGSYSSLVAVSSGHLGSYIPFNTQCPDLLNQMQNFKELWKKS